jgi:hypothetical protein
MLAVSIYRWKAPLCRERCDLSSLIREYGVSENHERACPLPGHRREGTFDLLGTPRLERLKPHPQGPSSSLCLSQLGCARRIGRIPEEGHPRKLGNHLLEHSKLLPDKVGRHQGNSRDISPGPRKAGDESAL